MKFYRILSLAIVGIMLALCVASCGAATPEINVTVKIVADDDTVLDVTLPIKDKEPTVLKAFIEACIINEIEYTLTEDQMGVLDIEEYKDLGADKSEDGLVHYWMYLLNGAEPKEGRAGNNVIADGDVITFTYATLDPEEIK